MKNPTKKRSAVIEKSVFIGYLFLLTFILFFSCIEDGGEPTPINFNTSPPPKSEREIIFCRENPTNCFCTQKIDCIE